MTFLFIFTRKVPLKFKDEGFYNPSSTKIFPGRVEVTRPAIAAFAVPAFFLTLIILFLLSGAAFIFTPSSAFAENGADEYRVGVLRNFPPYYSLEKNTNKPAGSAIDVMNALAKKAGLKIRYVVFDDWTPLLQAIEQGQIDIIPNLGIIEERAPTVYFTSPLETFNISIFVRSTTHDIKGLDDLQGRKVGVVKNNKGLFIIKEFGKATPWIFESLDAAFLSLLSGNSDALVYPEPPVLEIARKSNLSGQIKTAGKPLAEVKRALAVAKRNRHLLDKLEPIAREFVTTSQYREIYAKWHGRDSYWNVQRVLFAAGIVIVILVAVFLVWHYFSLIVLSRNLQTSLNEQKKMGEALKESEERFRQIYEHMAVGVARVSLDFRVEQANAAYCGMLGYDGKELVGKSLADFTQKEYLPENLRLMSELVSGRIEHYRMEKGFIHKSGRLVLGILDSALVRDAAGKPAYFLGSVLDITERRRVEAEKEELEEQNRQLQKAESLGRMAGAIAHTFNNQLGVVMGNLEMAIDDLARGERPFNGLAEAMKAAEKAAEVSGQMLTYLGHTFEEQVPLDLAETCRQSLPFLRAMMPAEGVLESDLPIPGPVIRANAGHVQQALTNLVMNGREAAAGDGRSTVHLRVKTVPLTDIPPLPRFPVDWQPRGGDYACLEVADTGAGIAQSDIEKLFDPFFSTKFTGRGLGLSVVLGIVKAYGGVITVESKQGAGSTFRLFFPVISGYNRRALRPWAYIP